MIKLIKCYFKKFKKIAKKDIVYQYHSNIIQNGKADNKKMIAADFGWQISNALLEILSSDNVSGYEIEMIIKRL